MSKPFKHIGLFGRVRNEQIAQTLNEVKAYLLSRKLEVCLDQETASSIQETKLPCVTHEELGQTCDLIIVVGGDGSLLQAAREAAKNNTPVLGINRGRLGFLTDILPRELEAQVGAVLDGKFSEEERFLLDTQVIEKGKTLFQADALNDIVLMPGDVPHMIEFGIYINDQLVYSQRADGLITATPTGSTAYALSGGGPILHPNINALTLVPMFPHTLSSRPIVVDANSEIKIVIDKLNEQSPQISCDGQESVSVSPGGEIHIKKAKHKLRLIHPLDYNYYETLRSKLGWEGG